MPSKVGDWLSQELESSLSRQFQKQIKIKSPLQSFIKHPYLHET
jgi:hypothetical protein